MDLALINAIPFIVALLLAIRPLNRLLPKSARTWAVVGTMLALFGFLLTYYPELDDINLQFMADAQRQASLERMQRDPVGNAPFIEQLTTAMENAPPLPQVNGIVRDIEWIPELNLSLSYYLDGLSWIFALIITGMGAGIALYAGYYFEDDDEQRRFFMMFMAFAGAMLGLVLVGNILTLFVMWELTSITSFMLIGFKGRKDEDARFAALQALLITGAGGLALVGGLFLLGIVAGEALHLDGLTFEMVQILAADPHDVAHHALYPLLTVLILIGAFTKSAQFPFHFWLPGAMSAPTPASAYLHSATMVKAGIYLLARLYPVMHESDLWVFGLVGIGTFTMLIGGLFALFNRDMKAILAYSTVSKLGAMVALVGVPEGHGMKALLVMILAHALYKAALFLCTGTIEHSTGSRHLDKIGELWLDMKGTGVIFIISALSMAGIPILFGFTAKETLLDVFIELMLEEGFRLWLLPTLFVVLGSVFAVTAALIMIVDVFFVPPSEHFDYHPPTPFLNVTPGVLALGSLTLGLGAGVIIERLIQVALIERVNLPVIPSLSIVFMTSLGIIGLGYGIFQVRDNWVPYLDRVHILPRGRDLLQRLLDAFDRIGDWAVWFQNGFVRYYLVVILSVTALVIIASGQILHLLWGTPLLPDAITFDTVSIVRVLLLLLMIGAALITVRARRHLTAALAMGVVGYAIGGIFLLEPAPDVALVQLIVETLGTILIIMVLGRISSDQRRDAMSKLWKGNSMIGKFNIGIVRDFLIATVAGIAVFAFAFTALVNRPDRSTIAEYHLQNSYEQLAIEDVVGAIVTDYRGMDTIIEISVFSVAAIGVLTLLARGVDVVGSPLIPRREEVDFQGERDTQVLAQVQDATNLSTSFTRLVSRLILPLVFMMALAHIIHGSHAPGDGFTAGAILGLVTGLWYVVFGYEETKQRLRLFSPHRLLRIGITIVVGNALLPVLLGEPVLAHVQYDKLVGLSDFFEALGFHFNSTSVYEIGIAITVFGGVNAIMEAIAHPSLTAFEIEEASDNGNAPDAPNLDDTQPNPTTATDIS